MQPKLSVHVLGQLQVRRGDTEVRLRPAQRRVLAILQVEPDRALDRDGLIDRMWGDAPPRSASAALQVHLSAIRAVDPRLVLTTGHGYRAGVEADDRTKAARLASTVGVAATAEEWQRVLEVSARALRLWRGSPFPELANDPWAAPDLQRLEDMRRQLVDRRAHALLATGDHAGLANLARAEVARDPLEEAGWQQLMVALVGTGRPTAALRAYQQARRLLGEELGIEPGRPLRELAERIRYGGADDADPPAEDGASNLPSPGTSFVGREEDVDAVASLLEGGRAVTILGGPGVGKTRLAIEIGHDTLDRFPNGVWFVPLAPARTARDVTSSILTASRTEHPSIGLDDLARVLSPRRALLILDNCEHVLEPVTEFVRGVLERDGPLRILATSRNDLGVEGPTWGLGPLGVPAATDGAGQATATALASPALRLFVDRARSADRSFRLHADTIEVVADVCRSTAGIPLAIELAAGWLPAIAVSDLVHVFGPELGWRDDDAAELVPHASLAAAIDRSLDLLAQRDRALLTQLTVFAGTFSLSDAHVVCKPTEPIRAVAAGIARLVDASLLVVERRPRGRAVYRMLVPIRERLRAGLDVSAADPTRLAFVSHYLARAQAWCPDPFALGTDFAGMDDDIGNVRAAFDEALGDGRADDVARGICSLQGYFYDRYLWWECRDWLLKVVDDISDPAVLVQVWEVLGSFAQNVDDRDGAAQYFARAIRLARRIGDRNALAACLPSVAQLRAARGAWVAAQRAAERTLRLLGPRGSPAGRAIATYYLGEAMAYQGRVRQAIPLLLRASRLWRTSGQLHRSSYALSSLVMFAVLADLQRPARSHAPVALQLARAAGSEYRLLRALTASAAYEAAWGDAGVSHRLFVEAHAHLGPADYGRITDFLLPVCFLLRRIGREDWLLVVAREVERAIVMYGTSLSRPWEQVVERWRRDARQRGVVEADRDQVVDMSLTELAARTVAVLEESTPGQ